MGLKEHIQAGATLGRQTVTISNMASTGSISIGGTFAIIGLECDMGCRLRLYDNSASRDDAAEVSRSFGNTNVSASVALIGDFTMSNDGAYTIDPVLFGHALNQSTPQVFYRSSPSGGNLTLRYYLLEDVTVQPNALTTYDEPGRRVFSITGSSMADQAIISGTLSTGTYTVPQTYMLISASMGTNTHAARLRLYRYTSSLNNSTEQNRAFSTEPSESMGLIVDMIVSGSSPMYFTPKIIGSNLENMGTDLFQLVGDATKRDGNNELYFFLQNITGTIASPTVNLYLYALED